MFSSLIINKNNTLTINLKHKSENKNCRQVYQTKCQITLPLHYYMPNACKIMINNEQIDNNLLAYYTHPMTLYQPTVIGRAPFRAIYIMFSANIDMFVINTKIIIKKLHISRKYTFFYPMSSQI